MSAKQHVTIVLACFLVFGCSKSSPVNNTPGQTEVATRHEAARPSGADEPGLAVVHATHLESLPASEAPSLLNEQTSNEAGNASAVHPEADRVLSEAVHALRTRLAVISHNLANADTAAFKRSRVLLEDGDYQQMRLPGAQDAFNNYARLGMAAGYKASTSTSHKGIS